MAKVDVVVPCYNYGRFLERCVRSVLDQSIRDVRVLIIDDESSDDSFFLANKLANSDNRVAVIRHSRNLGHIQTFNEGIDWAKSDYFLLLSADDLLVSGALDRAISVMDQNPDIGLTYGESVVWSDDFPFPAIQEAPTFKWARQDIVAEMCKTSTNFVPTPTAITRTSCQKAVGGYRAWLPHTGDMEMWLRFGSRSAVARIDAVQAIYRKHRTAMSNAYFAEMSSDFRHRHRAFESFFDEYSSRLPNSRNLREQARRALARRAFLSGIGFLRRGRLNNGIRLIREAINIDPRLRYLPPVWYLLKIPGPEGREWASSQIRKLFKDSGRSPWSEAKRSETTVENRSSKL